MKWTVNGSLAFPPPKDEDEYVSNATTQRTIEVIRAEGHAAGYKDGLLAMTAWALNRKPRLTKSDLWDARVEINRTGSLPEDKEA